MKISQLIKALKDCKEELGDVHVGMSKDTEGNGYGTIGKESFGASEAKDCLIIYPWVDHIESEDIAKESE